MIVISVYDPVPLAIMIVVLAGLCLALGRRRLAVLAVAGPVLTGVATTVVKPVIERTKNGDLSYPSGHMGSAVAVAIVVALLLVSLLGARRWVDRGRRGGPDPVGRHGRARDDGDELPLLDRRGRRDSALRWLLCLSLAVLIDYRPPRPIRNGPLLGWQGRVGALGQSIFGRDAPTP